MPLSKKKKKKKCLAQLRLKQKPGSTPLFYRKLESNYHLHPEAAILKTSAVFISSKGTLSNKGNIIIYGASVINLVMLGLRKLPQPNNALFSRLSHTLRIYMKCLQHGATFYFNHIYFYCIKLDQANGQTTFLTFSVFFLFEID